MLLTGVALGIIISLLCLYVLYLRGAIAAVGVHSNALVAENKRLEAAKVESAANLGRLAAKVQELKKPYDIHFSDEQLNKLAMLVNDRVVRLYTAQQAEGLQKLN